MNASGLEPRSRWAARLLLSSPDQTREETTGRRRRRPCSRESRLEQAMTCGLARSWSRRRIGTLASDLLPVRTSWGETWCWSSRRKPDQD